MRYTSTLVIIVLLSTLLAISIADVNTFNFGFPRFPRTFSFGVATSAAQTEGAASVDGKGQSIWDAFAQLPGKIADGTSPNNATDFYYKYEQDIANMRNLGVKKFRMSLSWSRILPNGTRAGGINQSGIEFYNTVFYKLLRAGIEPVVTLYHWDLPQALHTSFGGWLNKEKIVEAFVDYADVCFENFPQIKTWLTINEPWATSLVAYSYGLYAPGVAGDNYYLITHNQLVAHAAVATRYRNQYRHLKGEIGIVLNSDFYEPYDANNPADVQATERYQLMNLGLFADPLYFGDYPQILKDMVGARLPTFTSLEKVALKGSVDFFGFNHYTSRIVGNYNLTEAQCSPGPFQRNADVQVRYCNGRDGVRLGPASETSYFNVYPAGIRKMVNWIANRYNNPEIRIYENGVDAPNEQNLPRSQAVLDDFRKDYLSSYIQELSNAVNIDGVNVSEYYVWALNDSWEWIGGTHSSKYGLHHVDFSSPARTRTIKKSGLWYKSLIANHKRRN